MPFITSDEVKQVRTSLKKAFPEIKFSVTKEHHSTLNVAIMEASVDFGTDYDQVNHLYIDRYYQGEAAKTLAEVANFVQDIKAQETTHQDADYGSIPNYYFRLNVGKWDKPYKLRN